jgi:carbon-monoxide dehydrogenase medium subunit
MTALQHGEILTEIRIPLPTAGTGSAYHKQERKVGDYATSGVAVQLTIDGNGIVTSAGIGLTNVNPVPLRASRSEEAIVGKPLSDETIKLAAQYAAEDCSPSSDLRGSEEYKRHITGVLVKRMIVKAAERAMR